MSQISKMKNHFGKKPKVMDRLLFLTTRDSAGVQNYNARWSLQDPAMQLLRNFKVSLQSVQFANSVYPIGAFNSRIYISDSGAVQTLDVPSNSYTGTEIAAALQTLFNATAGLTGVYTVIYDYQSKLLNISSTVAFLLATGDYDCYEELGFDSDLFASATSFTSSYPVQLSGTHYIDVLSNFSSLNFSVSGSTNTLVRIPLDVGFGEIVYYEPQTDDALEVSANQLHEVYISLRDERGYPWPLPKNSHMSLCLKVHSE